MMIKTPSDLNALKAKINAATSGKTQILVSLGTCGIAAGGSPIAAAFRKTIAEQGLDKDFEVFDEEERDDPINIPEDCAPIVDF